MSAKNWFRRSVHVREILADIHAFQGIQFERVEGLDDFLARPEAYLTEFDEDHRQAIKYVVLTRQAWTGREGAPVRPPAFAEWLIPLLLKQSRADAMLGDLEERFVEDCRKRGDSRARWLYAARVLHSLGPLLWSAMKRAGIFVAVVDYARRRLGL